MTLGGYDQSKFVVPGIDIQFHEINQNSGEWQMRLSGVYFDYRNGTKMPTLPLQPSFDNVTKEQLESTD